MSDLKPCPFCLSEEVSQQYQCGMFGDYFYVVCPECGTKGPRSVLMKQAITRWNERPLEKRNAADERTER
jgi:Lar family restriction alleviation protein